MFQTADLPTYAVMGPESEVPGGHGEIAMKKHVPLFKEMLWSQNTSIIIIDAATASGKSREIPSALAQVVRRQVLVMTPSTIDVKNMQRDCQAWSCYCMGGGERFGDKRKARVVFATTGLVQQWYASHGMGLFWYYDGIFFDEIDRMVTDPGSVSYTHLRAHET